MKRTVPGAVSGSGGGGAAAPTNFKSGHYRAWDELDARHSKI
jgi:hypothetical protein